MPQISVTQRFPVLERVIAGAYGPGALSTSRNQGEIWRAIEESLDARSLRKLLLELEALKTLTDQEIMHVYARNSAYDFQVPSDARKFFEFFTRWIQGAIREA